jgi:hypothetical protein
MITWATHHGTCPAGKGLPHCPFKIEPPSVPTHCFSVSQVLWVMGLAQGRHHHLWLTECTPPLTLEEVWGQLLPLKETCKGLEAFQRERKGILHFLMPPFMAKSLPSYSNILLHFYPQQPWDMWSLHLGKQVTRELSFLKASALCSLPSCSSVVFTKK